MNLFSFCQKIKYRLKAKSRHGVHSPFVFDFIEKVLNGKTLAGKSIVPEWSNLAERQRIIIERICNYYGVNSLCFGNQNGILLNDKSIPVLYVYSESSDLSFPYKENDIVVVLDINSAENKYREWTGLCQNQEVKLSIDIFEMGILFFRKDFLVKQHFILKY